MAENILEIADREAFRSWLQEHGSTEKECWLVLKRGRPCDEEHFWYLDAVEEALCFGWIDSTHGPVNGVVRQRFTPRRKNSLWTELNKERVRRLEQMGRMTDAGRAVLPPMGPRSFKMDPQIEQAMKKARVWSRFRTFPPLYQRVRVYNVVFYRNRDPQAYQRALDHLIDMTKQGKMFGDWNDYGRLCAYEGKEKTKL